MKFLTLVRHAAAVHDSAFADFDRPLRPKGVEKAKSNSSAVLSAGIIPDLYISSPAARALQTAELFLKTSENELTLRDSEFKDTEIILDKRLYLPSPGDVLDCVREIDDKFSDVFLFSHNNGISWAAQDFCNEAGIIMPTGCAVRIGFEIESWHDAAFGSGRKLEIFP